MGSHKAVLLEKFIELVSVLHQKGLSLVLTSVMVQDSAALESGRQQLADDRLDHAAAVELLQRHHLCEDVLEMRRQRIAPPNCAAELRRRIARRRTDFQAL